MAHLDIIGPYDHKCKNCDHIQKITVNHDMGCIEYCHGCSWKPSFGNPDYQIPFNGHTYRPFEFVKDDGITP